MSSAVGFRTVPRTTGQRTLGRHLHVYARRSGRLTNIGGPPRKRRPPCAAPRAGRQELVVAPASPGALPRGRLVERGRRCSVAARRVRACPVMELRDEQWRVLSGGLARAVPHPLRESVLDLPEGARLRGFTSSPLSPLPYPLWRIPRRCEHEVPLAEARHVSGACVAAERTRPDLVIVDDLLCAFVAPPSLAEQRSTPVLAPIEADAAPEAAAIEVGMAPDTSTSTSRAEEVSATEAGPEELALSTGGATTLPRVDDVERSHAPVPVDARVRSPLALRIAVFVFVCVCVSSLVTLAYAFIF